MIYLQPQEYEAFCLAPETPDALIATAGALMEAHCRRPTLLAASYTERLRLTAGRHNLRLSYGPLLPGAIVSARVRFATPRRGEEVLCESHFGNGNFGTEVAQAFSLNGSWSALDPASIDIGTGARELTLPGNFLGLGYNEAEIVYTAGFVTVPDQVKAACAQIVRNAQATPALNVQKSRMDTLQMQYFAPTLLTDDIRSLLKPYVAERL